MLVFTDDADLLENGQGCEEMMNEVLKEHAALCEIIGGKIQSSKSGSPPRKWTLKNWIKALKHIEKI